LNFAARWRLCCRNHRLMCRSAPEPEGDSNPY
jgi:hypothetical protein